jgi:hypothetical protein
LTKLLYANGCSWTSGNGVNEDPAFPKDITEREKYSLMRKYTWPTVLAEKLNLECVNESMGGGSNKRMVRKTCDFLMNYPKDSYDDLIVVLGWSTIERDEIYLEDGENSDWYHFNAMQKFSTNRLGTLNPLLDKSIDEYQKIYVTHVHSTRASMTYYIQQKFLMSNMLKGLGVKYVFFDSLPPKFHADKFDYGVMLDKIQTPNMMDDTFSVWCNVNNIPLSWCVHPMIDGHKLWAGHVYEKIISLYGETL